MSVCRFLECLGLPLFLAATIPLFSNASLAADWSVKEIRLGATASIQAKSTFESGFYPTVVLYFDPLDSANAATWREKLLRPQLHAGLSVSSAGNASQVYAGFNWKVDITDRVFLDLGFGGTVHNGDLDDDGTDGPKLGCSLLFHEYAAAGFRVTDKVDILATIDHSSNADLCDVNDGISHAGLMLAYKF